MKINSRIVSKEIRGKLFKQEDNIAMKNEPIMIFHIDCYDDQVSEMKLDNGCRVCFIPFGGHVESELFSGTVLPGAADIQVTNTAGVNHMCAKYMFKGTDCKGNDCYLFVENNGYFERNSFHDPFEATPAMMTDSKELAPYLMGNHFRSEGHGKPGGVDIYIFDTDKDI